MYARHAYLRWTDIGVILWRFVVLKSNWRWNDNQIFFLFKKSHTQQIAFEIQIYQNRSFGMSRILSGITNKYKDEDTEKDKLCRCQSLNKYKA